MSIEQPTPDRQRQTVIALAVVFAVLAAVGLGALLLRGGDDDDRLGAPTASPSPAPSTVEPTPEPSPSPGPETTPPSPGPEPVFDVEGALLSPEDASAAEEPGFAVDQAHEPAPGPLLDPCNDGAFPGEPVASTERAMGSERETGGSRLVQEVLRYPDERQAAAAFDAFVESVAQCPEAPVVEGEGTNRFTVVDDGEVDGARTLLVQVQECGPDDACNPGFVSYLLLAQDGDGLTDAFYGLGEDGDPAEQAAALRDAVASRLVATVRG